MNSMNNAGVGAGSRRLIGRLLSWFWNGITAIPEYFHIWCYTRRWKFLLSGLPAALIFFTILFPVLWYTESNQLQLTNKYRSAAQVAFNQGDQDTAELYVRKVLQKDPEDELARFALARIAAAKDDHARSLRIMRALAPEDSFGYPEAHYSLAKAMAPGLTKDDANVDVLIHHLHGALEMDPTPIEVHFMLGEMFFQRENFNPAAIHLKRASEEDRSACYQLGITYEALGSPAAAKKQFQQAATHLQERLVEHPEDDASRVFLASAFFKLEEFERAKALLIDRLNTDRDNQQLRSALITLYLAETDRLANSRTPWTARRFVLLEEALRLEPNHPSVLTRVALLAYLEGDQRAKAREALQDSLVHGKAPAMVHLVLGTSEVLTGDAEKAKFHFEQAIRLNPQMPILLNNFAWLLANSKDRDLEQALVLVNRALEALPDHTSIRETRGQIYFRLERWHDALGDLEFALKDFDNSIDVHQSLALVYEQLGHLELAERHALRAGELKAERDAEN